MKTAIQSRRDFIRTTSLAAASLPFISTLNLCAQDAVPSRKIGFALAGLGNLSTHQLAPALQKTKSCKLTGIVTGHPAKAEKWKAYLSLVKHSLHQNLRKNAAEISSSRV